MRSKLQNTATTIVSFFPTNLLCNLQYGDDPYEQKKRRHNGQLVDVENLFHTL